MNSSKLYTSLVYTCASEVSIKFQSAATATHEKRSGTTAYSLEVAGFQILLAATMSEVDKQVMAVQNLRTLVLGKTCANCAFPPMNRAKPVLKCLLGIL